MDFVVEFINNYSFMESTIAQGYDKIELYFLVS